jgi:hypothetical protein
MAIRVCCHSLPHASGRRFSDTEGQNCLRRQSPALQNISIARVHGSIIKKGSGFSRANSRMRAINPFTIKRSCNFVRTRKAHLLVTYLTLLGEKLNEVSGAPRDHLTVDRFDPPEDDCQGPARMIVDAARTWRMELSLAAQPSSCCLDHCSHSRTKLLSHRFPAPSAELRG